MPDKGLPMIDMEGGRQRTTAEATAPGSYHGGYPALSAGEPAPHLLTQ
ncbi:MULTISPECIES: hypothetical protein [unclassified Mesorhizobium]|nr:MULTISPECIES: hypothetical protein [unclassified Mesorhizobium]